LVNRHDALCNPANPAQAVTPHEALALIFAQMRKQYDVGVLMPFIRMTGVYPPGSVTTPMRRKAHERRPLAGSHRKAAGQRQMNVDLLSRMIRFTSSRSTALSSMTCPPTKAMR